ncbi:osmoprotectant transport system ATP-binding protein [Streptoalloteichus tenebrarius]|uniref:Osmoprotectant transport system ATP-binding protein n=1 Tax=Streptoalloteichus tenebrarius (strain ATCC 17920 / DSM 40477 / JCM 4838 / CBS 697.72 / NBRC 16177 / NCIMB 11028 / NRRL B-12390 / A12253. 1 / ISP 5477) TaxID=1933 RepID=A0ABT1HT65_STRSD|nr:ABC transporter ATP-binding protein [Streptoalloteichus tenebrarius]MCP2258720.1 osmoprotectant transport system ATP-binding protein [Streptoalloteichus tenebrarius]
MIEFRAVTKRFDDGTVAVDHLDLSVAAGTITVFVGPSGCGKTTSLRMVNRMVEPTSGTVLVDGVDVRGVDPATLRRGIGYVIQQAGLFPHRTVLDNVATVPLLSGWTRRKARARAAELLELVGLPRELGSRYPVQLSGGQQQRVGVARALAADPPVLLMDEPFSAVDPVVREGLQDELLRLQAELDKTIVFVTHDIDEAVKIGERVAVFRQGGRLVQYAEPDELLSRPADEFVSSFVGRDRGYRRLSFVEGTGIEPREVPTAREEAVAGERVAPDAWTLVLDGEDRPRGWLPPRSTGDSAPPAERVLPGGSLYTRGTPLRGALDAALSSPSGLGVVVEEDGRYAGAVTAEEVLAALREHRVGPEEHTGGTR